MQTTAGKSFAALIDLCDFAITHSRFYQRTIKRPQTLADFQSLPMLTGDDIRHNVDPAGHGDLLTGSVKASVVVSTSASTGPKKFIFREYSEQHRVSQRIAEALTLAGMTGDDRIANLFPPGNLAGAWQGFQEAIEQIGATSLPIGCAISSDKQKRLIDCLQPTGFVGIPTSLIQLLETGIPRFQKVLCGGEGLNDKVRASLETALNTRISLLYGSVECGIVGVQCSALRGSNHYHIFEDDMLLEIIDPKTGCAAQEGEIVITNLHQRLQPMIRYRLGDRGQWRDSACSCGRHGAVIELKGRMSDTSTMVNGLVIHYEIIENALSSLSQFSGRFQLRVNKNGSDDLLNIIVEAENLTAQLVTNVLIAKLPELQSQIQRGLVDVKVVPRGGLVVEGDKTLRIADARLKQ